MSKDYPDDLRYTKEHEWARVEGEAKGKAEGKKVVTVGITQFAVEQLGDITQVDLPKEGETVRREQELASVESVKAVSDIYAPVSGKVIKVNNPLADQPENLNEDCYDEGWMVQIELSDPRELELLMTAKQYEEYLKEHG